MRAITRVCSSLFEKHIGKTPGVAESDILAQTLPINRVSKKRFAAT
jgi:hypothetical protein